MSIPQPAFIGKYEIIGILGRGGMGVVYRARDPRMGRLVAIKTVTEDFIHDATMLQRFYREAEKTGMLKHPNIVTVYDLGEHEGFPYIVMEYVEGDALDGLIKANAPLPLVYKLKIIEQVCAALGYAHHNDVIHRDVKPANVIIQPDGVAKLLDFGIARHEKKESNLSLTAIGSVIGTAPYMAPERLKGVPMDGRSDIFATGVLLYQFLTGQLPFSGEDTVLVNKLLSEQHPPLSNYIQDYPPALDSILNRALAKNPEDRYSTAEEMAAELYSVIEALKKDHVEEMIARAGALVGQQDYLRARDTLLQLLKLDNQNTKARRLLADVQQNLSRKQREEQARHLVAQAEDAVIDKNLESAISLLEQASRMVPEDANIADMLESTRRRKATQEKIDGYLRQADAAMQSGDYPSAQAIVERALELDKHNSRIQAAHNMLVKQAEVAAQQAKIKGLMDAARKSLQERKHQQALDLLRQAEQLDPSRFDLHDLLRAAEAGVKQDLRRAMLDDIERQMAAATTSEQTQNIATLVERALEQMPADPSLLRYSAQLDRQLREFAARKLVDDTLRECQARLEKEPAEAQEIVHNALKQLPGNDMLLAIQTSIAERIARLKQEELCNNSLLNARQALGRHEFSEAVRILESCPSGVLPEEISELLDFARKEALLEKQRELVATCSAQARALVANGDFVAAATLLESALRQAEDPGLRSLLEQARTLQRDVQSRIEQTMASLKNMLEIEDHYQAVPFLQALPSEVRRDPQISNALRDTQASLAREMEQLPLMGRRYAELNLHTPGKAPQDKQTMLQACGDSRLLRDMLTALEARSGSNSSAGETHPAKKTWLKHNWKS